MWSKLLNPRRVYGRQYPVCSERSPFAADVDRIIFSSSFRRLSRKSQVHPLAMNDHLHSRMSHSLEVSCVGRSLGTGVGTFLAGRGELPKDIHPVNVGEIVQAACLAHDIGNPPFGHAGEEAIRGWFLDSENAKYLEMLDPSVRTDFTCFDGNAQGFRVITRLEMGGVDTGGLNLTYPVIASMVKYPITSYRADVARKGKSRKYSYHVSEKNIFLEIFDVLGLMKTQKHIRRHPLSYLVEAADDICYSVIDLEDACEIRLVTCDEVLDVYRNILSDDKIENVNKQPSVRRKVGYIRALVINALVNSVKEAFARYYDAVICGDVDDIISMCNYDALKCVDDAKALARGKVYSEHRKTVLEVGAYSVYSTLLNVFIPAAYYSVVNDKKLIMYKYSKALEILGDSLHANDKYETRSDELYSAYIGVIDYVSGMTDSYATFVAQQFSGAGTGPWQA
ncbi:deoxyguanosinetriphosphate triphosphohydrolase [Desulfovibrio oxamicus]|uniref:Deoxyguanosinetriphosphate triphosphohydrolase n=1 Tax=Nitratidesulfovibrio oxamicus TaxID=32016 RepID=A0ABS0J3C5_9BACT|nr:deoxyguanosinetriphosphate triphosphohydrolase [Nitratidesulfovibrio oxamicus]MBG3876952.1 deoxyguanosinetriphosphate triphosphohydrolase [Nitratidesulfovibrio oxamicus]